jgi:hypothetical protein
VCSGNPDTENYPEEIIKSAVYLIRTVQPWAWHEQGPSQVK